MYVVCLLDSSRLQCSSNIDCARNAVGNFTLHAAHVHLVLQHQLVTSTGGPASDRASGCIAAVAHGWPAGNCFR